MAADEQETKDPPPALTPLPAEPSIRNPSRASTDLSPFGPSAPSPRFVDPVRLASELASRMLRVLVLASK